MALLQVILSLLFFAKSLQTRSTIMFLPDFKILKLMFRTCFEKDDPPVDTGLLFFGKTCTDKMGNIFSPGAHPLTSCCQCLE